MKGSRFIPGPASPRPLPIRPPVLFLPSLILGIGFRTTAGILADRQTTWTSTLQTISKLDSELSNKRIRPQGGPAAAAASSNGKAGTAFASTPKNGTNANAKRPASASTKPKATSTKPVSAGNQQQKKKREAPPLDPAEEEKRKKRAERFGQQA